MGGSASTEGTTPSSLECAITRIVVQAEQRYRGQIEFLVRRLKPEGAFGLSFTVGLAALAVCVWIFGGVLQDVLAHEEIALIDAPIVSYISVHRLAWLIRCMESITYLGSARASDGDCHCR